jgi:hypothetical protein
MKNSDLDILKDLVLKIKNMILERTLHDFFIEKINYAVNDDKLSIEGNKISSTYKDSKSFMQSKRSKADNFEIVVEDNKIIYTGTNYSGNKTEYKCLTFGDNEIIEVEEIDTTTYIFSGSKELSSLKRETNYRKYQNNRLLFKNKRTIESAIDNSAKNMSSASDETMYVIGNNEAIIKNISINDGYEPSLVMFSKSDNFETPPFNDRVDNRQTVFMWSSYTISELEFNNLLDTHQKESQPKQLQKK